MWFWRFTDICMSFGKKGIVPNWWQGIYDQLLSGIINKLFVISNLRRKSANSWTCQLYYYAFSGHKLTEFKINAFLHENLIMAKMFQNNIYYSMSIKGYIVFIQEIYGVLSLSMEFYLCLWNYIFVYVVLSLSMDFYLCIWSSIFVCGVPSFSMEFNLCLWSSIFVYGVLSLHMDFYLCISSCFVILLL